MLIFAGFRAYVQDIECNASPCQGTISFKGLPHIGSRKARLPGLEAETFHTSLVLLNQLIAFATFLAVEQKTLITSLFLVKAHAARLGLVSWRWS